MVHTPIPYSTVKQLSASASSSTAAFPINYIAQNPSTTAVNEYESAVQTQIPTIDFSLLSTTNPENRAQIVRELARACEEWGFFSVVNHGVAEELRAAMMEACAAFFELREEEKEEYRGRHVMDPIRCGTSFNSSVEDVNYWRDFLKVFVHPEFHCPARPAVFK